MKQAYTFSGSEGHQLCHPRKADNFYHLAHNVAGKVCGAGWCPVEVQLIKNDRGKKLLESDSLWLGEYALVLNERALDALRSLLLGDGELLSLSCRGATLTLFNATRVVPVLDHCRSSLLRLSSGKILDVEAYAFLGAQLTGFEIFRIPELQPSPIFVGEKFVDAWHQAELRGLDFKLVWSG